MESKTIPSCAETRLEIRRIGVLRVSRLLGQPFETVARWANGWDIPAIIRKRMAKFFEEGNDNE